MRRPLRVRAPLAPGPTGKAPAPPLAQPPPRPRQHPPCAPARTPSAAKPPLLPRLARPPPPVAPPAASWPSFHSCAPRAGPAHAPLGPPARPQPSPRRRSPLRRRHRSCSLARPPPGFTLVTATTPSTVLHIAFFAYTTSTSPGASLSLPTTHLSNPPHASPLQRSRLCLCVYG